MSIFVSYIMQPHRWLEWERSDQVQPNTIKLLSAAFSVKYTALRGKSKYWLAQNQVWISKWMAMSICGLLFQWTSNGVAYPFEKARHLQLVLSTMAGLSIFTIWFKESSLSWSYGSWIYNYLCNQCLSPLKLWVWTLFMARCTHYNIMW
jgi:hypothetical protein